MKLSIKVNKYKFRRIANRLVRRRLLAVYNLLNQYATANIDGDKITYNPNTDIGNSLFFKGEFEKNELELCKKYIRKDSIVLDVGANIGLHSIYFSKIAEKGIVFSFEPSIETFVLLLKNIKNRANVLPLNIALSDSNGISEFYVASDDAYSSLKNTKRKSIKTIQKTISYKLDDFFLSLNLDRIDFVKIDVEGLEHNVLTGMQWIIERYCPVIFCEIYKGESSNQHPEKTINLLIGKGYDAFVMAENELSRYEKHVDSMYNYLFLPNGRR